MSDIHGTPPPCNDCGHQRRAHVAGGGCSAADCLCLAYTPQRIGSHPVSFEPQSGEQYDHDRREAAKARNDARRWTEDPPSCIHGFSGNGAGCVVCEAAHACERSGEALDEIAAIIGTRFMDPPDGGNVSLVEQVRRMSAALESGDEALAINSILRSELANIHAVLTDDEDESPLCAAEQRMHDLATWKECSETDSRRASVAEADNAQLRRRLALYENPALFDTVFEAIETVCDGNFYDRPQDQETYRLCRRALEAMIAAVPKCSECGRIFCEHLRAAAIRGQR